MCDKRTWYAVVRWGSPTVGTPDPPRGPFDSEERARMALARWKRSDAAWRSQEANRMSLSVYGYRTRAQARDADISDNIGQRGRVS